MRYGCDLSEKNIAKARSQYPAITYTQNVEDIFKDPEVELVLIATPTATHYELASRALEAGKHVFIEKPMCGSVDEAKSLVELAKKQNKFLFVDHTFAFAPSVTKMCSLVNEGMLGKLLYFDSTRINLGIIQPDTNVLWDLAIHDLSILATLKDLTTITSLCAHGSKFYGKQIEVAHLHLSFNDGFMAHIHVSWLSPVKIRKTILAGAKAMLTYDDTEPSEKVRIYDKGVEHDTSKPNPMLPTYRSGDVLIPAIPPKETLAIEATTVLSCIRENGKPLVSGNDGLATLQILEAANESLTSGLPVRL